MWEERTIVFDNNLCRLCGCSSNHLYSIESNSINEVTPIDELIRKLTPLKLETKDRKPQRVCHNCVTTLENYDAFVTMCVATDVTFNTILQNSKPIQEINKETENRGNIIWVEEEKDQVLEQSNSILLLSRTNDNTSAQNQDFYVMLELDCRGMGVNPLLIECSDKNKTVISSLKVSTELKNNATEIKSVKSQNHLSETNQNSKTNKPEPQLYKCNVCNKSLTRKSNLISHLALHSEDKPHKCSECGKDFAVSTDLTLHKHIHAGSFSCEVCKKCFVTKSKLERHRKSHSGIKDHKCPICDKRFAEKTNMTAHLSVHTGERPFACLVCKKTFRTQSHLTDHKKVHSSDAPYKCNICGKSFKWKTNLRDHNKFHSGEKFKCVSCLKEFNVRTDYYKHRKACRKMIEGITCEFCTEKFDSESEHLEHMARFHKDKNY